MMKRALDSVSPPVSSHAKHKVRHRSKSPDRKHHEKKKKKHHSDHRSDRNHHKKSKKKDKKHNRKDDLVGYTNDDNPFGDENLTDTFVWNKKLERDGLTSLDAREKRQLAERKLKENRRELEKVKYRRLEREREQAIRDEELDHMRREKEAAQFAGWEKQEDEFLLEQSLLRSEIRLNYGRAKPIDILAKYINASPEDDTGYDVNEPYAVLVGLNRLDLEDLLADIKIYIEVEQGKNEEFWSDMTVLAGSELERLAKLEPDGDKAGQRREGINESVRGDVSSIFKGKSYMQLLELQKQIESKINSGETLDIAYWESLLKKLKVFTARARLKTKHQERLREKLNYLKEKQQDQIILESVASKSVGEPLFPVQRPDDDVNIQSLSPNPADDDDEDENSETLRDKCYTLYDEGNYSPRLITLTDFSKCKYTVIDPKDDIEALERSRRAIKKRRGIVPWLGTSSSNAGITAGERNFLKEAKKGHEEGEEDFNIDVNLKDQIYQWQDKYRPRKPRFFNRVHTGYEWNKYNQTHYDTDNPPPKIVQGYKFNIFYPDLIDKIQTPQYYLEPCSDSKEFVILRFHAGPPYEDIAFKIVNREWEYSHKKGFRSQFHKNIFQLWFHFRRYRYRR